MKIIVDAMGGDNAPEEVVHGAIKASSELDVNIVLVGVERVIKPLLNSNTNRIEVVNAEEIISNDDSPVKAIRSKKDSSIVKGLNLLKELKCDAMVSAGNTGALMAGGLFILKRLNGIDRPAIATIIPTKKDLTLLLDIGANSEVKSKNLIQFALMGSVYSRELLGKANPRIGLLNIGAEEQKGNSVTKSAYSTLKQVPEINFVGNVEARAFFDGNADVVVCDGFVGNVFIKTIEGFGSFVFDKLKGKIKSKPTYALGALLLKPALIEIRNNLDYSEHGGAMFLGLNGILIKCHGSSDRRAILNGIRVAMKFAESNLDEKLRKSIENVPEGEI
ncbi:MAG: phosphate acyltransferase PlsX [Thermoanaerobacterales bacterium]|nr:phosphate acyltransferase PlsX [Thermoanaerobacterales bacterium]